MQVIVSNLTIKTKTDVGKERLKMVKRNIHRRRLWKQITLVKLRKRKWLYFSMLFLLPISNLREIKVTKSSWGLVEFLSEVSRKILLRCFLNGKLRISYISVWLMLNGAVSKFSCNFKDKKWPISRYCFQPLINNSLQCFVAADKKLRSDN